MVAPDNGEKDIKNSKTKEEMIEILESEPLIMENLKRQYKNSLPPKKYFWLKNGVVIKSLYQLSDALKAMDDDLFEQHVTEHKNDFSHWIEHSLRNKELAKKIHKANTKSAMIDALDVYL